VLAALLLSPLLSLSLSLSLPPSLSEPGGRLSKFFTAVDTRQRGRDRERRERTDLGRRGLVVMAAGWLSLDRQFEPYLRANTVAPSWCGLGCRSRTLMVEYISSLFLTW
jgi:hypothetical protein